MTRRTGPSRRLAPILLVATLLVGGCHPGQARRLGGLEDDLRRAAPPDRNGTPPGELASLDHDELVAEVLRRNPSVEAARQAWRGALARHPQATALDDPSIAYGTTPASLADSDVRDGHRVSVSQRLPFPGRLALRGEVALAEAEAAREGWEATRRRLALTAVHLLDDAILVEGALRIHREHHRLVRELEESARARYETGSVPQEAVLQARTEAIRLEQRRLVLEARRDVIRARINELLHRPPDASLPEFPGSLPESDSPALAGRLEARALEGRPSIRAELARIRAAEAREELAFLAWFPDVTLGAGWSGLWGVEDYRYGVGLRFDLPVPSGRRTGAAEEAAASLEEARLELAAERDRVRTEVRTARDRLREARETVRLLTEELVPVARDRIEAARTGFEAGRAAMEALIGAERTLRRSELDALEARVERHRRAAELEHAVGRIPGLIPGLHRRESP